MDEREKLDVAYRAVGEAIAMRADGDEIRGWEILTEVIEAEADAGGPGAEKAKLWAKKGRDLIKRLREEKE